MLLFFATLHALLPLFVLIVLGYGLKHGRVLHAAHVPIMNGLVMNVTMPALIIKGLLGAPHLSPQMALPPLAILVMEIVTAALALALGRLMRLSRPVQGAMLLIGAFGNTGFLGYPITLALLPPQFPVSILIDQFGMTVPLYLGAAVVGGMFSAGAGDIRATREAIVRFLRGPVFLSLMAGMALRLVPWPYALTHTEFMRGLGGVLSPCLTYLGQGTTPLVLLALGVALRPAAVRDALVPTFAACALKLAVCPVAVWLIGRALGLHGDLLQVTVLEGAMPTAVMASVLCAQHDLAGDYAVGVVFMGTVLSAVTVPLMMTFLR